MRPENLPFARPEAPEASAAARGEAAVVLPQSIVDLPYREAKQRATTAFDSVYFATVLERAGGNVSEAARQAGLDRSNFRRAARKAGMLKS